MHSAFRFGAGMMLAASLGFLACQNNGRTPVTKVAGMEVPNLLPEDTLRGVPGEQAMINASFRQAIGDLRKNSDDPKPLLDLAAAYLQEGRISGNDAYYNHAALRLLGQVLDDGSPATADQRFYALSLKSAVLLNLRQYQEALNIAHEALGIAQDNANIWGCLVDAYIGLGQYDSAVKACDRMVNLRPDLRSYSRVSALRQIYGDNAGAIAAMKMAVQSGISGLESTEWARVQLGDLFLHTGKRDSAARMYRLALAYRPGYGQAEMGLARVSASEGATDSAIAHAQAALKAAREPAFMAYLASLYERKGDATKARGLRDELLRTVEQTVRRADKNQFEKPNNDRDMALAYLTAKEYNKALAFARKDYERRPANIDASALMAWISYKKNELDAAKLYAEKSMATHTKDAALLYKSGIIFSAAGDRQRGDALKQEALSIMPYLDLRSLQEG